VEVWQAGMHGEWGVDSVSGTCAWSGVGKGR
jgi:hypothetical protein